MRKIYRYELPVDGEVHTLDMPLYYVNQGFRRVEAIRDDLVEFWIQTDRADTLAHGPYERRFTVLGTGQDVPDGAWVHGTTARTQSGHVWHLCEVSAVT